ncbi:MULTISPECIES: hypothetical protein [Desulfococcus]|uniref:ABC transporter related protein n=1 Tax=Desulfococcus multivorans DSM 2059 TaxID=1121405 RepID=S7VD38_DESML|nr:hypothetical protein [Desulfococcus multivorans]AOY60430.1 uncharacterized protein Dmul_36620 [Desulfococcus multivorans]EPR42373.1 hypothetical protein dsmv_1668 [Desulfococcus multivorans DSM 2059]SJZ61410.1 polar amino acid transport system ATP-binding protein/lipoprotein-releasing system ATP-binding protein/glutamine transport system ATP-binding protein [Desulfococcus multivorans DSM 2059]
MIQVRNLHKRFGNLEVIKGIDLHIRPGEGVWMDGSMPSCFP